MMPTDSRYRTFQGDPRGKRQGRPVTGNARYADSQSTLTGRVARLWNYSTHPTTFRRDAQRRAGFVVSGALSHRAKGLGLVTLGCTRNRTRSEVLQTDARRAKATRNAGSELGSTRARDRSEEHTSELQSRLL